MQSVLTYNNTEYIEIPDWEGYYVSIDGKVYSSKTDKVLKPRMTHDGYIRYFLYNGNIRRHIFAHILVYKTYKPQEYNKKLQINHIDGNKLNNHISNLEMCTASENILHAFSIGLKIPTKRLGKEVPCAMCGKFVYKKRHLLKKRKTFYCSRKCVANRKRES